MQEQIVMISPARFKTKHLRRKDIKIGPRKRSVSQDDCPHKTAVVTGNHYLGAKCPRCGKQGIFACFNPGDVAWLDGLDRFGKKVKRDGIQKEGN